MRLIKSILYPFMARSLRQRIFFKIQLFKHVLINKNLKLRSPYELIIAKKFIDFRNSKTNEEWTELKNNLLLGLNDHSKRIIESYELRINYIAENNLINLNLLFTKKEKEEQRACSKELMKISRKVNKYKFSFLSSECFYGYSGLRWLPENEKLRLKNGICIDGGACEGDTAIMLINQFKAMEIHAFEIEKNNYNKLLKTIQKSKTDKIKPKFIGLSDCDGEGQVIKSGTGSSLTNRKDDKDSIELRKIDSLYSIDKKISLIKLDVEGMEQKVLSGAKNVIKRNKPILAVSIYHSVQDFFLIKSQIESMDSSYKFIIGQADPFSTTSEIMLIAY
jgi:FkbM family methyltransferase